MPHNTVTTAARRLNMLGLNRFEDWLKTVNSDGKTTVAPPTKLYYDAETSEAIDGVGSLPLIVETKMEMAKAVHEALGNKRKAMMNDEGFWTALVLLYIEKIAPSHNGKRTLLIDSNYVMPSIEAMRDGAKAYRHRVWGPCYLYSRFGEYARAFLCKDLSHHDDAFESIIYYNQAYLSVAQAVDAMYYDGEGGYVGVTGNVLDDHQKAQNLRNGSIRAFIEHCRQIGYTHSLAHISPEVLIESANKLEFQPQLANARRRREANDLPWVSMPAAAAA